MNVAVIGTGYVGLTTGVALAHLGHCVTCVDTDEAKLEALRCGRIPIYEPFLESVLTSNRAQLCFTSVYADAIPQADVVFIAVGTPSLADGNSDMRFVRAAAQSVGEHLGDGFTVIVNKSTVPIGSGNWVESLVRESLEARGIAADFAIASNPEFLREGSALHDSFFPDRIVVGSDSERAIGILEGLYGAIVAQSFEPPVGLTRPSQQKPVPFVRADLASAELVKYAANAFLALKISFINEMAELGERVGANVQTVARGIGLDARIGERFLQAGIGWGGSCFGKDTAALIATAHEYGLSMPIVAAAREVNAQARARIIERLLAELKILKGRTIGLMGLAFKPNTDDLRDAPALEIARRLIERGARVRVHDPVALGRLKLEHSGLGVIPVDDVMALAQDADALVLVTEWPAYLELSWEDVIAVMRNPLILDGRNVLEQTRLEAAGARVIGVGR
jgi:UDPglucose 6-dehydrogenase